MGDLKPLTDEESVAITQRGRLVAAALARLELPADRISALALICLGVDCLEFGDGIHDRERLLAECERIIDAPRTMATLRKLGRLGPDGKAQPR